VNTEAIDVPQRRRNTTLSKEVHQSMDTLRVVQMKVPKHSVIRNISLGMSFMTAIHGRKLDRISDEEHGQIVEDKVLDTLFGVEFGSPAANITDGIT
jgi:hypothetical protein